MLSRVAASFTVAKVTVGTPSERAIEHTVVSSGRVEKDQELAVITQPDILVKSVLVKEGQSVKKGDVLIQLDMESLQEQIDGITQEINALETGVSRAEEDYNQTAEKNRKAVNQASSKLKAAQDALASYKKKGGGDEATLAQLKDDVAAAQEAYDAACAAKQEENKTSKRALEDAQNANNGDGTLDDLYAHRKQLNKIKENSGHVCAPADGVVTGIITTVGQKTTDTAAVTMTDNSTGLRFVAQITKDAAAYISAGDAVTLQSAGKEVEDVSVDTIEADETGETLTVTVRLPAGKLALGQSADMTATRNSEKYTCTIPLMALFQENNKNFVYIIDEKDTVLGTRMVARKVEVKVLDKNDTYAALDASVLDTDSQIITDMDRYVEEGDEVRLAGE
ncbi:MAG: biotin/lipoyl-binding protein [Clostridia bacterium]|nr:biotin/lipoyl-binding protein [Clostridia bacterium]